MIPLNQEQRLGRTAYFLIVSRKMTAGMVVLLVGAIFLVVSDGIIAFLSSTMKLAGIGNSGDMALFIVQGAIAILFILGLLICLIGVIVARMEYGNYTFTFEEFDMRLKRGVISLTEVSIPYRSMQDVDLERNILHRMTKTSRVVIDSAGHEEKNERNKTSILLEPIEREKAEEIRLMLQRKIGVQVVLGVNEADKEAQVPTPNQALD